MTEHERHFTIVNGIAYGEESKGNTVQAVVRELGAHTVWRSGGWQGGHHITHDDGREIALSHFGAGAFEGAETYLKHMVISPVELFQEAVALEDLGVPNPLETIVFDQDNLTTTPYHSGISRTREVLRGDARKGTIGKGVGEALRDANNPDLSIRAGEFKDRMLVRQKIENIRRAKLQAAEDLVANHKGHVPEEVHDEMNVLYNGSLVPLIGDSLFYASELVDITDDSYLDRLLKRKGAIINEVSHGALHHPRYGFLPHVTQIDPTSRDVMQTLDKQGYDGNLIRLGIVRSYLTRHGAGPFMSYSPELTDTLVETHNNAANEWLGDFKTGHFDIIALKYALEFSGGADSYDGLFVSYMDRIKDQAEWGVVEAYEYTGEETDLDRYFERDENHITGIRVHPDMNPVEHTAHQMQLTQYLKDCSPIVTTLTADEGQSMEETFLSYVTGKLDVPVAGTAYGPKVTDRHFHEAWNKALHK